MSSVADLRRQVDKVDIQIVELLGRRNTLVKQEMTQLDEEEPDTDREHQVLANWLEEGFDHELNEPALAKVAQAVIDLGRKAKDH